MNPLAYLNLTPSNLTLSNLTNSDLKYSELTYPDLTYLLRDLICPNLTSNKIVHHTVCCKSLLQLFLEKLLS